MATRFKVSADIEVKGDFLNGGFIKPKDLNGDWVCKSPADFNDEFGKIQYSYSSVDEALRSSRTAFHSWRKISLADRANYLKKYQAALKKHEELLCELIAREVGKPLWEAKTEVSSMLAKVDITLEESMRFVADFEIPTVDDVQGKCRFRPLGVMAVIGPFNLPGHLPNGHIAPALLTGNTVVFKPSEKTPLVGQVMAECFKEAGLPPGVFSVIQGEREVGRRLVTHEGVDGVLFTGSYEVGTRIKQDTLQQHWKLLALEMGGKNSAIVSRDADLDVALQECLLGAFLTTGQRCSATSRILVERSLVTEFVDRFHERSKAFKIGHPVDNPLMGPLIDQGSVDRFTKFLGIAAREGSEIIMRGKSLELESPGYYVTPSICFTQQLTLDQSRKSIYQQTELFAPNVVIVGVESIDEAIAQANVTQFGLAASVFTKNQAIYEHCLNELEAGVINWNRSTVGASSKLPFGGLKKSGNHFPTAVTAAKYCTYPVASLECKDAIGKNSAATKIPGLNWK
jgi:succinylglutamic semialdehyde dehydrogenase